jgi:UDP-N-acetylglucosamine 2-epimerase (non-hydrolysing)
VSARVCFVVGARPNFMKSAPVYKELSALDPSLELVLLHTGQHYDDAMSDVFFRELGMPKPDESLGVGPGTHAEQTAKALIGVERFLGEREIDLCVVAGDVNSTLAGALAAVKSGVKLAHIESGLRSFDRAMPEEHNRVLTDHLSDILLAHSEEAITNLQREGITSGVHLVGNTMIDSLLEHLDKARERRSWERFGLQPGEYALVTLHRPALVDDAAKLAAVTDGLITLAADRPLLFPIHPRTLRNLESSGDDGRLRDSGVIATEPLGYLDFLCLEADASFVLTDSGGIQEETTALGVRCFTLRGSTERRVTEELGTNTVLGAKPERIAEIPRLLKRPKPGDVVPGWDGSAGARAAAALRAFLSG